LDYSYVTPLALSVYINEVNQLCSVINPAKGSTTYLPIKRIQNWDSVKQTFFDKSSLRLLYTLGSFYGIIASFSFIQLVAVGIFVVVGRIKHYSLSTLVTSAIFVFTLIRAVYFFLVPTGELSSNGSVAEYILIVFPTFPYFTAFSCVPLVWAVLTLTAVKKSGNIQRIFKAVSAVNIVLYIVFIIIVVVFNQTKKILTNQCVGEWESTQLTGGQKAISIVYSVIISFISLVIAISFIVFGRRFTAKSQMQVVIIKTYRTAAICALGFMLNCLFILIVTGARLNNIAFSFAGLLISEIIPSVFILANFGVFSILRRIIFFDSETNTASKSTVETTTPPTGSADSTTTTTVVASEPPEGDLSIKSEELVSL